MCALPIRLGISARGDSLAAPNAGLPRFFKGALKAVNDEKDIPPAPPAKSERVFYGQSRPFTYSLDKNAPNYNEVMAKYIERAKQGYERANENDLTSHIWYWNINGYDPFPTQRPRRVGAVLDLSSAETRGLGEHPLKSRFDATRKALIDETEGVVTALLTTGQVVSGNYAIPFSQATATYYAQNNIVTDADPFRDETDDPGLAKSATFAMNNIASLDDALQLIMQAFAKDPRSLTDLVITAHGDDGEMQFVDAGGNALLVDIGALDGFLSSLTNRRIIKPGAQLHLMGCSVVNSKKSQEILQNLSTKYGVRIIANRTTATMRRPALSNAMVFYPGTDTERGLVRKYYKLKNAAAAGIISP